MSAICIVDTSVFCNLLRVPNRDQRHTEALNDLKSYVENGYTLLLPLATIYETGNHIANNGSGQQRRAAAKRFVDQVEKAIRGENPFSPTHMHQVDEVLTWLHTFPDEAMRGIGLVDLSLIQIFNQQCQMHRSRRVFIWSYDKRHLSSYDHSP